MGSVKGGGEDEIGKFELEGSRDSYGSINLLSSFSGNMLLAILASFLTWQMETRKSLVSGTSLSMGPWNSILKETKITSSSCSVIWKRSASVKLLSKWWSRK